MNIEYEFSRAIQAAGIPPPDEIVADGGLHRFSTSGKKTDKAGWYIVFNDGMAAGVFGCWRNGVESTWSAKSNDQMTPSEVAAFENKVQAAQAMRDQVTVLENAKAAKKANQMLGRAIEATADHPYLQRKQIQPHGTYLNGDVLLVPMLGVDGQIWNVEQIFKDGQKRGLTGGRRTGLFFQFGSITDFVLLCEGFSTGASVFEATGVATFVCFNAGNLMNVAKDIQSRYPNVTITIAGDDDRHNEINVGRDKGEAAAKAVGGRAVFPLFAGEDGSDFNDMAILFGLAAVRDRIMGAEESGIPDLADRPCFMVFDRSRKVDGKTFGEGVWHFSFKQDAKGNVDLIDQWICSPIRVEATTLDKQDANFGRMLRFKNSAGRWAKWAMPMAMLAGDGIEVRSELLDRGCSINPTARSRLAQFIQSRPPKKQVTCCTQTGWFGDTFVLPSIVIGNGSDDVIFQASGGVNDEFTTAGSIEGWLDGVGRMARNNPILSMAIAAGFAAPLMKKCNLESGGIHLVGSSSTGKTTAIDVAASVWGGNGYKRSWRATANGLEGAAAGFNDSLFCLDEISECDPREVGSIVYALANGVGKQRSSRTGSARPVTRWRCFVLSSGERTVATSMAEGGKTAKAGQAVRLLDIPCQRTFGAWDDLHGFATGTQLSDHLKLQATKHHGVIGRAYLERLTRDETVFTDRLETFKQMAAFNIIDDVGGQAKRAATRFALLAMAGELATQYGLTGWAAGEATEASAVGLAIWLENRGSSDNQETRAVLDAVQDFIDRHGDSRFSVLNGSPDAPVVRDRAGWRDGSTYLFTPEGMREATKGVDLKAALNALAASGWLEPSGESKGNKAKVMRVDGQIKRLYLIKPRSDLD